jgi:hypothetical protein
MGYIDHPLKLHFYVKSTRVFLEDYRESLTLWASSLLGGANWILFSLTGCMPFVIAALGLHFVPMIPYYFIYRPFGIYIKFIPMANIDGEKRPDLRAGAADEAILDNKSVSIYLRVIISDHLEEFSLEFSTPDELVVELRDIPMTEHVLDRENNILSASNITNREFTVILDVYDVSSSSNEAYSLKVIEEIYQRIIKTINIIIK